MKILAKLSEIILVVDNKGDIGLIEEFFNDAKLIMNFYIAENGEKAIRFYVVKINFLVICPRYNPFGLEFIEKKWT
jgi:hypothetical protein